MGLTLILMLVVAMGSPLYILTQAISMVIPGYLVLLGIAVIASTLYFWNPYQIFSDQIFAILLWLIAGVVTLLGIIFAPFWLQLGFAMLAIAGQRFYLPRLYH